MRRPSLQSDADGRPGPQMLPLGMNQNKSTLRAPVWVGTLAPSLYGGRHEWSDKSHSFSKVTQVGNEAKMGGQADPRPLVLLSYTFGQIGHHYRKG